RSIFPRRGAGCSVVTCARESAGPDWTAAIGTRRAEFGRRCPAAAIRVLPAGNRSRLVSSFGHSRQNQHPRSFLRAPGCVYWRPGPLAYEPDVSISRLQTTPARGSHYRLGDAGDSQECEFSDSEFILRRGGTAISMPFASVGSGCLIGWSGGSGMRKLMIDYVRPALQISLLPKDRLALHSAAVAYEGKGILLAGWAESGKTEAMLGFLQAGAAFVSDKWTIVDGDGSTIRHFPTPITVRNWMIDLIPGLQDRLKGMELLRARAAGLATSVLRVEALSRAPLTPEAKGLA